MATASRRAAAAARGPVRNDRDDTLSGYMHKAIAA